MKNIGQKMRPHHKGFAIDDSLVVPVPGSKEVIVLDPLARIIWEALYSGLSPVATSEMVAEAFSMEVYDAYHDICDIISEWQHAKLLVKSFTSQYLQIGERVIVIENHCGDVTPLIATAFDHLEIKPSKLWDCCFKVLDEGAFIRLIKNGTTLLDAPYADTIARRLIFEVIEEGYRHLEFISVLHAAAFVWKDKCILLPALGGSDKTTLAAAMMHAGAHYLADDVVPLMSQEGEICPLRTSLCLKENSWAALTSRFPEIPKLPVLLQDGKPIRYLPPPRVPNDVRALQKVDVMVFPNYQAGTEATITPLNSVDVFKKLVSTATWLGNEIGDTELLALIYLSEKTETYEMGYGNLEDGVSLLSSLFEKKKNNSRAAPVKSASLENPTDTPIRSPEKAQDSVVVKLCAGFGNNIFQIIAGHVLALRLSKLSNVEHPCQVIVPDSVYTSKASALYEILGGHLRADIHYTDSHRDHSLPSPFDMQAIFPAINWITLDPVTTSPDTSLPDDAFLSANFSSVRFDEIFSKEQYCVSTHDPRAAKVGNLYFLRSLVPFPRDYWYPEVRRVQELFNPSLAILRYIRSVYGIDENENLIGVHIRNDQRVADIHRTDAVPLQWYVDCIKDAVKPGGKAKLLIVSNRVLNNEASCSMGENLKNEIRRYSNEIEVIESNEEPYYIDFFLLRMCKYLVISSSTFSFSAGMTSRKLEKMYVPNNFSDRHFFGGNFPHWCHFIPEGAAVTAVPS
jgi:hypothetical protein